MSQALMAQKQVTLATTAQANPSYRFHQPVQSDALGHLDSLRRRCRLSAPGEFDGGLGMALVSTSRNAMRSRFSSSETA